MKTAGNDLNETIALAATANEIIQNPESVGNALKTVSMRLRGQIAEEDENGDTVWSPAKLGQLIEKTTAKYTKDNVGISLLADDGNFKSTYDILYDISQVWNDINSNEQSALLERMAGKHRATVVAALLSDSERLKEALETAENSAGSALSEWEKRTKSIEHALGSLNAAWQEFSMNTIPAETITGFINFAESLLELAQNIGAIKILTTLLGTIAGIGAVTKVAPYLKNVAMASQDASKNNFIGPLTFDDYNATKASGALAKLERHIFDTEAASARLDKKLTTAATNAKLAFTGLGKVILTVGKALAKSFALGMLVTGIVNILEKATEAFQEQKHKVSDLQDEINELNSSISDLNSEISQLRSKDVLSTSEKERLDFLEDEVALEERLLEIKKEQQAREFIEDSNKYFDNDNSGVNSEFYDAMKESDKAISDYEVKLSEVERFQKNIAYYAEKMSEFEPGTDKYDHYAQNLKRAQKQLVEAEIERANSLSDLGDSLKGLQTQQSYYENALKYCTDAEREQLLAEKASVDQKVWAMQVLVGTRSTYSDLREEVEKLTPKISYLDDTLKKVNDTQSLSFEEVDALKAEYPSLGSKIVGSCKKTETGFIIEGEALEELRSIYIKTQQTQLETSIKASEVAIQESQARIDQYLAESDTLLALMQTMLSVNEVDSTLRMSGMGYNPTTDALANATPEERELFTQYQDDLRTIRQQKEALQKAKEELEELKKNSGTITEDGKGLGDTSGATDLFDKYANALANAREEIERYGAAVELAQAQLDLNQSQEERSVELLGEEQELYGKLLEAQQARYKIVNDTLWLQQQQLKAVKEEASQKVSAKLGTDVDVSNWTQADVEEFVYNLKVDTSEADADLANFLNAMIEMQGDVDSLYVDWYNMKKEIRDTELEQLQKVIDFQNDSLEQFDDARKQTEKILSLLEEVEDTEDERLNIVKNLSDSYEGQKETIMAMHQANVAQMHELAKDMERNQQAYNRLVEQNQKLEEDYLDVIQAQLNYKQQQIDLEQELAEKRAESEIYGDKGKDKWEDARQDEIDSLNDQIDELNKKAEEDDFAEQMAEYEKDIAEKEQEIADLYKKLDNLRSQKTVQTLEQQADGSFQWKYVEDQIAINETLEEIADKEVEIEELKNEKKKAEEERALEEEIAHLEAQIEAIEDEVERRQQLFDEELQVIEDTYQKEKAKLAQWLQDEITHWQTRVAENEIGLTNYDAMNTAGWNLINTNTDAALTDLEGTYDLHFQNIVDTIGRHAATAIAHINAIAAAQRRAAEAAREAAAARASADSADGSHAMGLRFVEANNYVARLHYGERVLTRQEAQQYNAIEEDLKAGHLKAYFDSMKQETADRISTGISTSVARIGSSVPMAGNNSSTSFVIEHLELPNVQDAQDFANVLQRWAKQEFGGLAQKAKIVKAR